MIGNIRRSNQAYIKSALYPEMQQGLAFSGCKSADFFFARLLTFGLIPSYPGEPSH
jgi:hypothetical protein